MSDELVVLPPIESNKTTPGTGLIDHINDLNARVADIEGNGPFLPLAGGYMTGAIRWNSVASSPGDLSRLWHWYDGNDEIGDSITSTTRNFWCKNAGDKFDFWTGGVLHTRVDNTGLVVPEGQKLTIAGQDSDERYWLRTEEIAGTPGPQGDKGDKGEQGATGPAGEQGVPGVDGASGGATIGDIKAGFQTADHAGWIILDGRAITALTATQQTAATSLGFTANLPDSLNAVPLQNMGVMGTVSGSNERVLTQANLPAIDLTTDEQGLHRHTMRSVENDNGKQNLQNLFMGKYDTDEQLWNGGMDGATINNGNYAQIGAAMEGAGAHTHTVSLGGSATPIDITPKSMAVNQFVYLGA